MKARRGAVLAGVLAAVGLAVCTAGCAERGASPEADSAAAVEALSERGLAATEKAFLKNVKSADREVLDLYLRAGMSPSEALPDAVVAERCDLLPWLFERGADAESRPAIRALGVARSGGLQACGDELERRGTTIDMRDRTGATELIRAAGSGRCRALGRLLEAGADVDAASDVGLTALMASASVGEESCVRSLLEAGADIAAIDRDGWSALTYGADGGAVPVVDVLLDAGADFDAPTALGWTPLALTAVSGHLESARALLAAGADPRRPLLPGSPLEIATREGWDPLVAEFERWPPRRVAE